MKLLFTSFLCIILINSAFSTEHYYYKGKRIDLNQRTDKLVIVTNETSISKTSVLNELSSFIDAGDILINLHSNTYQILFKEEARFSKIQNYKSKFSSKNELIKFIIPSYYFDTYSTTIICTDEFIVRLKNESDKKILDNLNIQYGARVTESFPGSKLFVMKTFNKNPLTALDLSDVYFNSGIFEYCEPNFIYPDGCLLAFTPNDPSFTTQWNLKNTGQLVTANNNSNGVDPLTYNGLAGADMKVSQAWDYTTGSSSFEIGVMDTGIDSTHPDLRANVLTGYDALWNTNSVPVDSGNHGTCTGGIIAAVGNNNLGVTGIAYGCKIRSYRIFNAAGLTATIWVLRGFQRARQNNSALLNNSWGGTNPSSSITEEIDSLAIHGNNGKGCTIIFGSGNNGANPVGYPAYLPNVICVGASTAYDHKKAAGTGLQFWWGGNYGSSINGDIDMVAPTQVPSTDVQGTKGYNTRAGVFGDYEPEFNGTSCSCPNATGVAALIYSVNTNQTTEQVRDALLRGCDKIDNLPYSTTKTYGQWNDYTGYGRANAYNSVRLAAGVDVIPPAINHTNVETHNSTYPTTISAEITDLGGSGVDVSSPKVIYRLNKNLAGWSSYDTLTFQSQTGNTFTFKIPGAGWETQVQYYLTAKDNGNNIVYFPIHAPDTSSLCYYSVGNIQSITQKISGPTNINSLVGVSSNTTSFASFNIIKTKVRLYLRHTRVSDMNIALVSPNTNPAMNMKCIFSGNAIGTTTGITNASVMDSASMFWKESIQPYNGGIFKPDYIFSGLNGLNAAGNWKLVMYDNLSGIGGTLDSAFITLYKTSGVLSPQVVIYNPSDSIASFNGTNSDTLDFYLKNKGTGNLDISSAVFSGTYASNFSLLNSYPPTITPGDSGLFKILFYQVSLKSGVKGNVQADDFENATLDISTNDPSKPVVKISLQAPALLPVELISFTSSIEKNNVKLNWATSFENNNSGFDVERKLSGSAHWNKIAFIPGAGNTNLQSNYFYSDVNLSIGKYNYRLKQIDLNGNYKYYELSNEVTVGIPTQFFLSQNYPNPFNPTTNINYELPFKSKVQIKIFDLTGREVYQLVNETKPAGYYTAQFNAANLASGIYFYMINAEGEGKNFIKTMKMVLVK